VAEQPSALPAYAARAEQGEGDGMTQPVRPPSKKEIAELQQKLDDAVGAGRWFAAGFARYGEQLFCATRSGTRVFTESHSDPDTLIDLVIATEARLADIKPVAVSDGHAAR
jgi:hypothetical protein